MLRRQLNSGQCSGVTWLDGVKLADDRSMWFFAANTSATKLSDTAEATAKIGGGLRVTSTTADVPTRQSEGAVATDSEHDLLAGLNVGLVFASEINFAAVSDWLAYHATFTAMQAALIVDRAPAPGELADFLESTPVPGIDRVVVVSPGLPLGQTDAGPQSEAINAPDAPGRDRMVPGEPDPWQSALGEVLIFEALRRRFLSRARAVLNLEISDLILGDEDPFDAAFNADDGVCTLVGTRCYPWQTPTDRPISHGDHICRRFDSNGMHARWCVAPTRMPDEAIWRLVRIGGARSAPATGRFQRAMCLLFPDCRVGQLVPRTSLIEDPELLRNATERWNLQPVRMPRETTLPEPKTSRAVIVTCMKNEGPFLLEWIAYNRVIGFDDILVYSNDCTDGTDAFLDILQSNGIVVHRENPYRNSDMRPQHAALKAANGERVVKRAGWLMSIDCDEFLNIHVGDGKLADLFAEVPDANMISATWRLFGHAGQHEFKSDLILQTFTKCAPQMIRKPHQAWGFKTLFQNIGIYKKIGVHRPKGLRPQFMPQIQWVNGSGRPMPPSIYRNTWRSTSSTVGYDLVTLNHYAVRSAESFLVKRDRGRVNHTTRDQGLNYWFRMNNNAETDTSIQRMLPELRSELDRLMAIPEIAAAHERCVAAHTSRIAELRADNDYARFFDVLTSDRMDRLSRMHQHFGSNVFLAGPHVVPDEVAFSDPPDGFFFTCDPSLIEEE